ncbi:putative pectinesterase inhibitor domain-containing protein [Arabidopsis thaliana]|uniref:Pectinesterase inhibitor domain n=1 Tax=Arabidopsis thaliana x Arabidopsis arenosa TaxID=1240361 RepID=A0A8T2EU12_9BRAS|nr:Pectinesterase inhibitor domain [Arabidopsis thaliana x Arabidopsis arenosa]
MVAYVDKNFSLACFLVLLLFVDSSYARFNTLVTKDQIHTICTKQEINSSFCFQVLNTNPEIAKLDFPSLFKFVLNYQAQNISDTLKQFKLSGGYMPGVESQYSLCIELYGYAFENRDITLRYLAAKDYNSVNTRVSGTLEDIFTCTDDLSTMKPIPQIFMTESNLIKELSKILLVILECFISKRKEFCN